ncbi:hypothetical protein [Adlercreutzia sp. ZJ304]|nr:hypothetical protein [Adlercreutzia sp. ZJ304]
MTQIMVEPYVYAKHSDLTDEQTYSLEQFVEKYASEIEMEYKRKAQG